MRAAVVVVLSLVTACHRAEHDDSLEGYLDPLAGADEATRSAAVAGWKLDRDAWERVTTDPYSRQYQQYSTAFDEQARGLVVRLTSKGEIRTRPHYAGDPKLTIAQARARWAQPVPAPSEVAELDGVAIDAVFVRDGGRWKAIVGVDRIVLERTLAKNYSCAMLASGQVRGNCADFAWQVADAALRDDAPRLERACAQLTSLCARDP